MANVNTHNATKPKAVYYEENSLSGYVTPIVYNETVKNNKVPVVNTDTSALTKNLHSEQAMDVAAESLGDDAE